MENHILTKPTLMTHKKLIKTLYMNLIMEVIEYVSNDLKLTQKDKNKLRCEILKYKNIEKILKLNTTKKIRNSLIKFKEK